jgi:hypothetical protein
MDFGKFLPATTAGCVDALADVGMSSVELATMPMKSIIWTVEAIDVGQAIARDITVGEGKSLALIKKALSDNLVEGSDIGYMVGYLNGLIAGLHYGPPIGPLTIPRILMNFFRKV